MKTTDFNQELEEYNCKSLFEVYSVQYSEPAIKSLVRKSEILKIPQVLPKNFLTQSNTDKVELFYDKRYPVIFQHYNSVFFPLKFQINC